MDIRTAPLAHPALVECPLCDTLAEVDAAAGVLACDACDVRLELAADGTPALPLAA